MVLQFKKLHGGFLLLSFGTVRQLLFTEMSVFQGTPRHTCPYPPQARISNYNKHRLLFYARGYCLRGTAAYGRVIESLGS